MTPADLRELADRCERATGPDRDLDHRLFCTIHGWSHPLHGAGLNEYRVIGEPAYTASLDAAMSLVPEGWDGALYLQSPGLRPNVQLETEAMRRAGTLDRFMPIEGSGETLALALCAASLRARADHLQSEGNS